MKKLVIVLFFMLFSCQANRPFYNTESVVDIDLRSISANTVDYDSLYNDAIKHIKKYEAFSSTVYTDNDGSRTIGYGHHMSKNENWGQISENFADRLLRKDFDKRLKLVQDTYQVEGVKSIAIALFIYNIGSGNYERSTLKKLVDQGKPIDKEIVKWCHYRKGGIVYTSKKLLERRRFELKIYNMG